MKIVKREKESHGSTMYGHKLTNRRQLATEGYVEQTYDFSARKILSIELVRMNLPHPVDVIETTYLKNGVVEREYRELESIRSKEELENGQTIFKTLGKILNKRDVRAIKAVDFLKEILERLASDTRFAYKQINSKNYKNTAHSVYIYPLIAIIVATVSSTVNLDFSSPVEISISKQGACLILTFKTLTNQNVIGSREWLAKNPRLESKLAYLCALCREDNMKSTIRIVDNLVIFEYVIKEASPEVPRVYAKEDEQLKVFYELLNAFNPPLSDDAVSDGEVSI